MKPHDPSNAPRWFAMSPVPGPGDSPPPAAHVDVEFGARSRQGPGRFANEDNYLILRLARHQETLLTSLPEYSFPRRFDEFAYGMVIADGTGHDGEAASRLAISTLVHLAVYFGKWHVRIDEAIATEVMDRVERFYQGIDTTLLHASRHNELGLQSTLTAVLTAGDELIFAHVGHSRAYLYRDGQLLQLTFDSTATGEHLGRPSIVNMVAGADDLQHTLTDTIIGTAHAGPRVAIERCGLLNGDAVLLCTNGLTDVVDDAAITALLRLYGTPDEQCGALVDRAVAAGATDDVTVLMAHYRIPG